MITVVEFRGKNAKGQLISKCPFGVIVWTKISEISTLATKERANKKLY